MHRDPVVGLSSPDGHQQGLQGELGGHARLGRPANDPAREQRWFGLFEQMSGVF
jgi:hypothetical protein